MTRQAWIHWAVEQLNKVNNPTSRLDAEVLLAHVLGVERLKLHMYPEAPVEDAQGRAFEALIQRRVQDEPVAYLTGTQEFMGMDFNVSPAVLIPRPDTELLVEQVLAFLREEQDRHPAKETWRAADIGTGSGCIAVSLAALFPGLAIMAVDLSSEALAVAKTNIVRHNLESQVLPRLGDLLAPVEEWTGESGLLDAIVSNPPYITRQEMEELASSVADYEPHSALAGGWDGLDFYRQLTKGAPPLLRAGGLLAFEIGHQQGEAVVALMKQQGLLQVQVLKDLAGYDRVVLGRRA